MHPTAMTNCKSFFDAYAGPLRSGSFGSASYVPTSRIKVVEIGSQDVNGSLRQVSPIEFEYVGVDFQAAKGVDIVLQDPYALPFDSESVDMVVSSSCFEHSEMFWLIFLEILRVLKPHGLFYLNAPSAGSFHRYPVDCWRFYPDSGKALVAWARRNGLNAALLESFTQKGGGWQDFVAVFLKDAHHASAFPSRILHTKKDFENGQLFGSDEVLCVSGSCQNDRKLLAISQIVNEQLIVN